MPHFMILSRTQERFCVRVADCDEAHALSVLSSVRHDPYTPSDLYKIEVENLYGEAPTKVKKRRLLRRG